MNYSLFVIKGGKYDGRVVLENNDTNYKIILATPVLKAKVGVSMLSYDDDNKLMKVTYEPTTILEQKKLLPHLLNKLISQISTDIINAGITKINRHTVLADNHIEPNHSINKYI